MTLVWYYWTCSPICTVYCVAVRFCFCLLLDVWLRYSLEWRCRNSFCTFSRCWLCCYFSAGIAVSDFALRMHCGASRSLTGDLGSKGWRQMSCLALRSLTGDLISKGWPRMRCLWILPLHGKEQPMCGLRNAHLVWFFKWPVKESRGVCAVGWSEDNKTEGMHFVMIWTEIYDLNFMTLSTTKAKITRVGTRTPKGFLNDHKAASAS